MFVIYIYIYKLWRDEINSERREAYKYNWVICWIQQIQRGPDRTPHKINWQKVKGGEEERTREKDVWVHRMCSLFVRFNAVLQLPLLPPTFTDKMARETLASNYYYFYYPMSWNLQGIFIIFMGFLNRGNRLYGSIWKAKSMKS